MCIYIHIYIDKVTIYIYISTQILLATREFYQVSVKVEDLVGPMEAPWRRGRDGKTHWISSGKWWNIWKQHGKIMGIARLKGWTWWNMMEHDGKMMEKWWNNDGTWWIWSTFLVGKLDIQGEICMRPGGLECTNKVAMSFSNCRAFKH